MPKFWSVVTTCLVVIALVCLTAFFLVVFSYNLEGEVEEIPPGEKKISDKGIYITSYVAKTPSYFNYIKRQAKAAGINTIVIDAKAILSEPLVKLAKEKKLNKHTIASPDPWLAKLTHELHKDGFIVSARLVVFKDDHLIIARPDLAIRVKDGKIYRDHKGSRWADPYSEEVRLYSALVAERAALSGVDEVQFDYIRFPAEGKAHSVYFPAEQEGVSRVEIICEFLKSVKERLKKYHVSIAVDIFGVTAWQIRRDINLLGQDLKAMAKYIDVLCPMFYPSHFHSGYDGYENPGDEPYYFVNMGVKKTKQILAGEEVAIVPWIQGFNMRSSNFGADYVREQIKACQDAGVNSFLVWNARNDYSATFTALKSN